MQYIAAGIGAVSIGANIGGTFGAFIGAMLTLCVFLVEHDKKR